LETLLSVYPPVEILYDRNKCFAALQHVMEKKCPGTRRAVAFPAAKKTLKMLSDHDYFRSKANSPAESWPKDLLLHLDEGQEKGLRALCDFF
jgi:hypothetical protein